MISGGRKWTCPWSRLEICSVELYKSYFSMNKWSFHPGVEGGNPSKSPRYLKGVYSSSQHFDCDSSLTLASAQAIGQKHKDI